MVSEISRWHKSECFSDKSECRSRQNRVYDNESSIQWVYQSSFRTKSGVLLRPSLPRWCSGHKKTCSKKLIPWACCRRRVRIMFRVAGGVMHEAVATVVSQHLVNSLKSNRVRPVWSIFHFGLPKNVCHGFLSAARSPDFFSVNASKFFLGFYKLLYRHTFYCQNPIRVIEKINETKTTTSTTITVDLSIAQHTIGIPYSRNLGRQQQQCPRHTNRPQQLRQ